MFPIVQKRIIGNEHIIGDHLFHHRMTAVFDIDLSFRVHLRPHIMVALRHMRERGEYVQLCNGAG